MDSDHQPDFDNTSDQRSDCPGGHRFPPERRHMLKTEERLTWLPPDSGLRSLEIKSGMVAVDVGAGTGFWTLPLSKLVGPEGTVYAVDVEPIMLEEIRVVAHDNQLANITTIASSELDIPLPDTCADVAIAGFVVHEPADPAGFVHEIVRLLRPGGRLLVVDWHKRPTEKGPPMEHRLTQEAVEGFLRTAGLEVERLDAPNADVYLLVGQRPQRHI